MKRTKLDKRFSAAREVGCNSVRITKTVNELAEELELTTTP
jgi:hypothetical protein